MLISKRIAGVIFRENGRFENGKDIKRDFHGAESDLFLNLGGKYTGVLLSQ